jgi:hypothetical protein
MGSEFSGGLSRRRLRRGNVGTCWCSRRGLQGRGCGRARRQIDGKADFGTLHPWAQLAMRRRPLTLILPPLLRPQLLRVQTRVAPILATTRTQQPILPTLKPHATLDTHKRCRRNPPCLVVSPHAVRVRRTPPTLRLSTPLFFRDDDHRQPRPFPRVSGVFSLAQAVFALSFFSLAVFLAGSCRAVAV